MYSAAQKLNWSQRAPPELLRRHITRRAEPHARQGERLAQGQRSRALGRQRVLSGGEQRRLGLGHLTRQTEDGDAEAAIAAHPPVGWLEITVHEPRGVRGRQALARGEVLLQ